MNKDLASVPDKLTVIGFPAAFAVLWLQEAAEKRSVIFLFFCLYSVLYVLSPIRKIKNYEFLSSSIMAAVCGIYCFLVIKISFLMKHDMVSIFVDVDVLLMIIALSLLFVFLCLFITWPSIRNEMGYARSGKINQRFTRGRYIFLSISFTLILFILSLSKINLDNVIITIPISLSFACCLVVLPQARAIAYHLVKFRRRFNRFRYL